MSLDDDHRLDDLLREAAEKLTPIPASLTQGVERRLQRARWRRRLAVSATALAASIALVWFISHLAMPKSAPKNGPELVKADTLPSKPERPDVRVTFAKGSNVIAVPIESDNPNVTVVMVYQAVRPNQRNRSDQ